MQGTSATVIHETIKLHKFLTGFILVVKYRSKEISQEKYFSVPKFDHITFHLISSCKGIIFITELRISLIDPFTPIFRQQNEGPKGVQSVNLTPCTIGPWFAIGYIIT